MPPRLRYQKGFKTELEKGLRVYLRVYFEIRIYFDPTPSNSMRKGCNPDLKLTNSVLRRKVVQRCMGAAAPAIQERFYSDPTPPINSPRTECNQYLEVSNEILRRYVVQRCGMNVAAPAIHARVYFDQPQPNSVRKGSNPDFKVSDEMLRKNFSSGFGWILFSSEPTSGSEVLHESRCAFDARRCFVGCRAIGEGDCGAGVWGLG